MTFRIVGWPIVDVKELRADDQPCFNKRKLAMELRVVDGKSPSKVNKRTGIRPADQDYLLERCRTLASDGLPWGYRALAPNRKLKYERQSEEGEGKAGLFQKLLKDHPEIKEKIHLWQDVGYEDPPRVFHHLTGRELRLKFLGLCTTAGIRDGQYPFTTQDQGLRSLQRYMRGRANAKPKIALINEVSEANMTAFLTDSFGTPSLKASRFLAQTQLDGYRIDAFGTVLLRTASGMFKRVPLDDSWLVSMICGGKKTPLGAALALSGNYNEGEVQECIATAMGVANLPKGNEEKWLPVHYFPELAWLAWDEMSLDRALAHRANDLFYVTTQIINAQMTFDEAHTPKKRGVIESLHAWLKQKGFVLMPNGYRQNPARFKRDAAIAAAMKMEITAEDLMDGVKAAFREHLTRPRPEHAGASELDYLRFLLNEPGTMVRKVPEFLRDPINILRYSFKATVRGGIKQGKRCHINHIGAEYRGDILSSTLHWLGRELQFVGNRLDGRYAIAYDNGEQIDVVRAQSPWDKSPHSYALRQRAIHQFHKAKLKFDIYGDGVQQFHDRLVERAASGDSKQSRRAAKEVARIDWELRRAGVPPADSEEREGTRAAPPLTERPAIHPRRHAGNRDDVVRAQIQQRAYRR